MPVSWRRQACFLIRIPWCSLRTCFTSHVIGIPNRLILLTDTKIARPWVFLTISWHVIVNCSCWTWLALIRCGVPIRTCFITIYVDTSIQFKTKSLFLWTGLICFYTTLVFTVPLLSKCTIRNAILINSWPFMIQGTFFTL